MADLKALRPAMPILLGAAIMLSLSMGLRQSFGLVMQPLTRDISVTVSDFTLALAIQNFAWGLLQPFAGALAVRVGFRRVMLTGAGLYVIGVLVLAGAGGLFSVIVGAGVLIGIALGMVAGAVGFVAKVRAALRG